MGYSASSLRYLHIAYALFIAVQIAYAVWLTVRWRRVTSALADERRLNG